MKSQQNVIDYGVPQGPILGPLLFLLYIIGLSTVSRSCFSILFADDNNILITDKDIQDICHRLNEDLVKILQWLCSNKLSLNVLKTHYVVFTLRNKMVEDINVITKKWSAVHVSSLISRACTLKLSWIYLSKAFKIHWYTCNSKKSAIKIMFISLHHTFGYPYIIYCNQVRDDAYQTNLENNTSSPQWIPVCSL